MKYFFTHHMVAFLVLVVLALSGCGIGTESEPSQLADGDVPASLVGGTLPTPGPEAALEGEGQAVFMIGPDNRRLIEVRRSVGDDPESILKSLLLGPTLGERQQGISTAMTRSTAVLRVDFDTLFQVATVTLAPDSLNPDSREQLLAYGQFVFTLTAIDGIETVTFEFEDVDGQREAIPVQTDRGLQERGLQVRRADYASIDPGFNIISFPDDDAQITVPTPSAIASSGSQLITIPIWVLNDEDHLVQVSRQVERTSSALLQTLFDGLVTSEQDRGLRSAVPFDALSRGIDLLATEGPDGDPIGLAVVDLTGDSLPSVEQGDELTLAIAQIVFTLTGLADIDQVLFTINGELTPMPTQFGLSELFDPDERIGLKRSDYAAYAPDVLVVDRNYVVAPTTAPTTEPTPTPES